MTRCELTAKLQPARLDSQPWPPTPVSSSEQTIEIATVPDQNGVLVGPGSYRAVTSDDGQILRGLSDYSGTTGSPGTTTHTIDRKRLGLGVQIIDFVLEHSVLLKNLIHHVYGVIRMPVVPPKVMLPAAESLFSFIRDEIPRNDDEAKLRVAVRIFQSSYQPILSATKLATVDQVYRAITAENLRWETIGNILAMAGLCLIHIPDRDFTLLDPARRSKQDLVKPFHEITDTMMTLTSSSPVVNEIGVCLKYNQLLLALYRFGDSSMCSVLFTIWTFLKSFFTASSANVTMVRSQQVSICTPSSWNSCLPFTRRACIETAPAALILQNIQASCTSGGGGASRLFTQSTKRLPRLLAARL